MKSSRHVDHAESKCGFAWACLFALVLLVVPHAEADLLVGSCFSKSVLRYDEVSGAFRGAFIPSGSGGLDCPEGAMVIGTDGNLYVTSFSPGRILDVDPSSDAVLRYNATTGTFISVFVQPSTMLDGPHGLTFGPDGNLYVSTRFTDSVLRFDGVTGDFIDAFVPAGSGGLDDASDLEFGPDGNLYVASLGSNEVLRFDGVTGDFIDAFVPAGSGGLSRPHNAIFGPDGNLYVTTFDPQSFTSGVLRFDGVTGDFIDAFVPAGSGGLVFAGGVTFGPDGNLYVSDDPTNTVLRFDGLTGDFVDVFVPAGSGGLNGATAIIFIPVPEPSSLLLLGSGLAGLGWIAWRRQQPRVGSPRGSGRGACPRLLWASRRATEGRRHSARQGSSSSRAPS